MVSCSAAEVLEFVAITEQGSICTLREALQMTGLLRGAVKVGGSSCLKLLAWCRHEAKIHVCLSFPFLFLLQPVKLVL